MNKDKKYLELNLKRYMEQKESIENMLMPEEKICHCLDSHSFGGRYYNPNWIVTNMGRIYSLHCRRWLHTFLKDTGEKSSKGEYKQCYYYIGNIAVHRLIANYFCDKVLIKKYGEDAVDVHHIRGFNPQLSCEENNRSSNIQYALNKKGKMKSEEGKDTTVPHDMATQIQRSGCCNNMDADGLFGILMRRVPNDEHAEVELLNGGGIRVKAHFGGTLTEQEAEEYAKKHNRKKEDFHYIRMDGTVHYGKL